MFLFAHLGYSFLFVEILTLVYFLLKSKTNDTAKENWGIKYFSFISLAIGAMGPDIIDKLISLPITDHGRYIGHSLIFDVLICFLVLIVFRKNKRIWLSFIIGWQLHLILDLGGFLPILFPFVSYEFPVRDQTFFEILSQPSVYINEIIGFLILTSLVLIYYHRGLRIKQFLKSDLSKEFSIEGNLK
ncbi:MAG: metal-dependent hydrolase [Candidatus Thorarchaeota archaeon]